MLSFTFFLQILHYSYIQEHLTPSTSICIFPCSFMIYQSCQNKYLSWLNLQPSYLVSFLKTFSNQKIQDIEPVRGSILTITRFWDNIWYIISCFHYSEYPPTIAGNLGNHISIMVIPEFLIDYIQNPICHTLQLCYTFWRMNGKLSICWQNMALRDYIGIGFNRVVIGA